MYGKLSGVSWLLQFGRTILWSVRGKRALREGRPVAYERQLFRRAMEWILVILLEVGVIALFACVGMPKAGLVLAGSLLVLLAFAAVVLWFRPSRETNWWVQVGGGAILVFLMIMVVTAVAFTENGPAENRKALARLPLTQADYCEMKGEPDHAEYSYQKSFFGSRLQGTVIWPNEELEENELSYNVYRSEYAWVLHKIWETETDTMYYKGTKETDPRPWKALEVRRNKNGIATCARYEDALLFLYADTPPAADQIELTLETLNLLKDTN